MLGKKTPARMVMIAALLLLGTACASNLPTAGALSTNQTPSPSISAGGDGGNYGGRYGGSPSPAAGANTIQAGAGGFRFSPSTLSVTTGTTIRVENVGTIRHNFTITGKGINHLIDPGTSRPVPINLPVGTYTFFCRFHVSFGMKGSLTVTG